MRRKSSATTRTKLTQPILRVLFRASFLSFSQCRFSFRFQFRFLNRFPEARVRKFLLSGLRRVRGVVARLLQLSPLVLLSERDRFGIFFWETGGEAVAHLFVFFSSSNIRGGCFFVSFYSFVFNSNAKTLFSSSSEETKDADFPPPHSFLPNPRKPFPSFLSFLTTPVSRA